MSTFKRVIYSEIESVKDDFLAVQDYLIDGCQVNLLDYACQYNDRVIDYNDDGTFSIGQIGFLDDDNAYVDLDCTLCEDAYDLDKFFEENVRPILEK